MMLSLLKLTAFVCVLIHTVVSTRNPCGNGKCLCSKDADRQKMDCANKNILSVKDILKDIPVNTTILDLSGNKISLLENKTFANCANLKNLQVLNLTDNQIKEIQKHAFSGLVLLEILDISFNYLTGVTALIPAYVQELCLNHNLITALANHTFSNPQKAVTKMKKLLLQNNTIREIEQLAFEGLNNLKILNISYNSIPFMAKGLVPAIFRPLKGLIELDIGNNTIDESTNMTYPDHILSDAKTLEILKMDGIANATFGPGFKELKNLTNLNLSGLNDYCKMHTLKNDTFRFLTSLKHLDISYCGLSAIEAQALSPLYQLDSIDMSGNKDLGYLALPNVFFGLRNTTVKTLKYSSMFRSRMGTEFKVKRLKYFNETKIKNLYADDNALEILEDDVFNHFPKTITYISVQYNRLMPGPWMFRLVALTNLEVVDISYQFPSPKIEFPFIQESNIENTRQIRSASEWCIDTSKIYPKKLKKIFYIGSKDEDIIPCLILNSQGTKLEEVRLSGNIFHSWQGPVTGLENLKILDLSKNYCSNIELKFFSTMSSLQELYINTNFIGLVLKKHEGIFRNRTNLRILDMSFNVISMLPSNVLEQQVHLERLNLSTNGLTGFEINMRHMNNLTYLNLAANSLSTLPLKIRNYIEERMNKNVMTVDMSDNPIKCTCDNKDFVNWLGKHRDGFIGFQNYTFLDKNGAKIKPHDFDETIEKMKKVCVGNGPILVISAVSCVSLLTIIILCTIYRYRWKLRYLYYMTKSKYRGYSRVHGSDTFDDYRYDAFISYAGEELLFIKNELVRELEDRRNLKLSVHQRDFMAGNPIAENIVDAVTNSRKTVLILTDNFLKSDWCVYEFRMAQMESNYSRDGRDIFVIVMLENIPNDSMPIDLLRLIQSQTYIEYPVNPQDRELFWNQVKDAILQVE